MIRVVISGGQTGVDRAALDAARDRGVLAAGWVPEGRRAKDGPLDPAYPVTETDDPGYVVRTVANLRTASATLILTWGGMTRGTLRTIRECREAGVIYQVAHLEEIHDEDTETRRVARAKVSSWIRGAGPWQGAATKDVLNVAGPSEESRPGVYTLAYGYLVELFTKPGIARRRL